VFAARGDDVIAVCRRKSAALEELGVQIEEDVDVTDDGEVQALAKRLDGRKIDLLVNNAGVLGQTTLSDLDMEMVRRQFEVNSLGPLRVSAALYKNMPSGSKIAIITSRMGSIADNTSGGYYGYRMSKAAVNMVGATLAVDLKSRGIAVGIYHPGFVRTEMTAHSGNVEPAEAAAMLAERMGELTPQTSGGFWHANGETLPW
jgi:NAD(P)-dependent dehydrogenase (short-subunit alcohol dehydrogenase family)